MFILLLAKLVLYGEGKRGMMNGLQSPKENNAGGQTLDCYAKGFSLALTFIKIKHYCKQFLQTDVA